MTGVLLDTHTLIWFVGSEKPLSETARALIEDGSVTKYVSIASLWEIAIKTGLGKLDIGLPLPDFITRFVDRYGFPILGVDRTHLFSLQTLPLHHRDPFDRILIAQSIAEGLPLVSGDANVALYPRPARLVRVKNGICADPY